MAESCKEQQVKVEEEVLQPVDKFVQEQRTAVRERAMQSMAAVPESISLLAGLGNRKNYRMGPGRCGPLGL
jgi:hypothetical protein